MNAAHRLKYGFPGPEKETVKADDIFGLTVKLGEEFIKRNESFEAPIQFNNPHPIVRKTVYGPGAGELSGQFYAWMVFCPACKTSHAFDKRWQFNGNFDKPTFTPSMNCFWTNPDTKQDVDRCHSFLTDGVWRFLSDCMHAMKDQQHPVIPFPGNWNIPNYGIIDQND